MGSLVLVLASVSIGHNPEGLRIVFVLTFTVVTRRYIVWLRMLQF